MATIKTVPTTASVDDHVAAIADAGQREDARVLIDLMGRVTGQPAVMWGDAIVGFDAYHYRYDSGREGQMPRLSFSPRKGKTVVYLMGGAAAHAARLARLGKHSFKGVCLHIKRLGDLDLAVLEEILAATLEEMAVKYPKA